MLQPDAAPTQPGNYPAPTYSQHAEFGYDPYALDLNPTAALVASLSARQAPGYGRSTPQYRPYTDAELMPPPPLPASASRSISNTSATSPAAPPPDRALRIMTPVETAAYYADQSVAMAARGEGENGLVAHVNKKRKR